MFATIELQKQAAADRYYHQLHLKPWAKSPEEAAWALMDETNIVAMNGRSD